MQRLLKVKMFYFHENGLKTYNKGNSGENLKHIFTYGAYDNPDIIYIFVICEYV